MRNNTVLLTGATGLLGSALNDALSARGWPLTLVARSVPRELVRPGQRVHEFSLEHSERIAPLVTESRPDWIIHAAANTAVDACEDDPGAARRLHVDATRELAGAAHRLGARFLLVSTDAVYDGDSSGAHSEGDALRPMSVYAATKLQAEGVCRQEHPGALIARVNFFGLRNGRPAGLAGWILESLRKEVALPGFSDVWFSPLLNVDLANLIGEAMEQNLTGETYNFGAADGVSKFDFARLLIAELGGSPDLVRAARLADAPMRAPRPKNTVMDPARLAAALGHRLPTVREGIQRFASLLRANASAFPLSSSL